MKPVPITQHAPLVNDRVSEFAGERLYLATGSVNDDGIVAPESVSYESRPSRADLSAKPGDVCFARMHGTRKVLKIDEASAEAILSTGFAVLRPNPEYLYSGYLRSWVASDAFQFAKDRLCTGATQKAITNAKIATLPIPLLPLAEQTRIAEILDAADALRAKRREALAQLDALLQSTFLDMFGDPVINPMRWRIGQLEDYFSKTRAGTCCGPFGSALKKHEYVDDGIPVWGIDNVKPNQFLQERSLFITPEKFAELQRYAVESGDILISRAGTVGRMCVAVPTVNQSIIGTNLIRLTLNPDAMLPVYFASLYTFCGERLPGLRASGDDRAYSFLNTTRLKSLVVPLPPIDLQLRFAAIVESIDE
ncbi:MAG: restriction endonuclease subunit S [Gammaproteobacteria bacterium]|nr:restriction endonuclease subunit S [Gammaproteobacteria bacterium]